MRYLLCLLALAAFAGEEITRELDMPNVAVRDQHGKARHFNDDLIKGKTVAINFIFTSCPTVCPPMGANFAALQKKLASRHLDDVGLISVSIDPRTDTPERLLAWRERFHGGEGWDLVTGSRAEIDKLLKMLRVFAADINTHAPFVVIGNADSGQWRYLNGLTAPDVLADKIAEIHPKRKASAEPATHNYFGDVALTDQNGVEQKLFDDLMTGKIVVINTFFSSCKGVCLATMSTMGELARWCGDRLGKDIHILSISVDPLTDTPARLKTYAAEIGVGKGWYLLTGDKPRVDQVLKKMGQYVEVRESHSNIFIMGNVPTGLWKKVFGLAGADQVIQSFKEVVADRG